MKCWKINQYSQTAIFFPADIWKPWSRTLNIRIWIKHHLQITVQDDTEAVLDNLNEASLHELFALSDDAARMNLMCMDAALQNGWKMQTVRHFVLDNSSFKIMIKDEFCTLFKEEKSCFALNYYGQMQLHQWLQVNF